MLRLARCAHVHILALFCVALQTNGLQVERFQEDPAVEAIFMPSTPDHNAPLVCNTELHGESNGARLVREPSCLKRDLKPIQCDIDEFPLAEESKRFWEGVQCPLGAEGLAKAALPKGHQGARLRLRRAMKKLGETGRLNISVIGTSMTRGWMAHRPWPIRLQDLFSHRGFEVSVLNLARGGSTSRWALTDFFALKGFLESSDVVLIDYELNDRAENKDFGSPNPEESIRMYYRDLLLMLIALPNKPAIVDLLTFSETPTESFARSQGFEKQEEVLDETEEVEAEHPMPTNNCQVVDITKYHHWKVNVDLDVPMISYTEGVCDAGRTFWTKENALHDHVGTPHPGTMTHDLFARVIYGVLLGELERGCNGDFADARDFGDGQAASEVGACIAEPSTAYDAKLGQNSFQPVKRDGSWSYFADSKDKFGWISRTERNGAGGNITFEVTTKKGWIQVEYLGTYTNIGWVSVWLDQENTALQGNTQCRLNGLWPDMVSLSRFGLLKTNLPPGKHHLTFQSHGEKFKILGIVSC